MRKRHLPKILFTKRVIHLLPLLNSMDTIHRYEYSHSNWREVEPFGIWIRFALRQRRLAHKKRLHCPRLAFDS